MLKPTYKYVLGKWLIVWRNEHTTMILPIFLTYLVGK